MKPPVLTAHTLIESVGDTATYNFPLEETLIQSLQLYFHERGQLSSNIYSPTQQICIDLLIFGIHKYLCARY